MRYFVNKIGYRSISVQDLVNISFFITIQIILTRFFSIQTPIVRIDFNIVAIAICSFMYGPFWGGLSAALADFIGVSLFPATGGYFPGFTLSMFLIGTNFGLFYELRTNSTRNASLKLIFSVVLTNAILYSLLLDTYWLTLLTGKGFFVLLPVRILRSIIIVPLQVLMIERGWNFMALKIIKIA